MSKNGNQNQGAAQAAADPANNPAVSVTDANAGAAEKAAADAAADGGNGALKPAEEPPVVDLSDEVAELKAKLAALTSESETKAAAQAAEAEHLRSENERLRDAMVSGAAVEAKEYDPDEMVEVRVKTPLVINPSPESWRYVEDGAPPPSATLTKGLNVVPRWVADHWLVQGSLED